MTGIIALGLVGLNEESFKNTNHDPNLKLHSGLTGSQFAALFSKEYFIFHIVSLSADKRPLLEEASPYN